MIRKKLHPHIKKHIIKHKRKYTKFILYFLILLTFGVVEDVTAVFLTKTEEMIEVIGVAILLSFIFTVIGEIIEEVYLAERKRFKR
ncbi:MAG: hypothetical protein PHU12_00735 [Candidatus Aenigmarchaeota archaeon]|nr:hypothetical protein [Candidatus Aenigmarchaeota archaeon]